MYRPPEMIDKYRRFNVSTKVDIWVSITSFSFHFTIDLNKFELFE